MYAPLLLLLLISDDLPLKPTKRQIYPPTDPASTHKQPNMLATEFFKHVETREVGDVTYEGYKAHYARSTLVLYSKRTKTPLAALIFKAEDVGTLALLTSRPSPHGIATPHFQGMLNLPDQAFNFAIVNLCTEGWINFNVLHTPHRVSSSDPGPAFGINAINELKPNEAYTINSDQRTDRAMKLLGKTKKAADNSMEVVTVAETETSPNPEGLYFHVSVVPQLGCRAQVGLFAEGTAWKAVSYVVRPVPRRAASITLNPFMPRGSRFVRAASIAPNPFSFGVVPQSIPVATNFVMPQDWDTRQWNGQLAPDTFGGPTRSYVPPLPETDGETAFGAPSFGSSFAAPTTFDPFGSSTIESSSFGATTFGGPASARSGSTPITSTWSAVPTSYCPPRASSFSFSAAPTDVGTTQAAEISYGQETRKVHVAQTGVQYNYDRHSDPMVVCLSIHPSLTFYPLPDLSQMVRDEIDEWQANRGHNLIAALNAVYKSDLCVIDLESPADTIISQCGHQCLHHSNCAQIGKLCPLCRGPITALVKVDGFIL
jgi:hypothetical protein